MSANIIEQIHNIRDEYFGSFMSYGEAEMQVYGLGLYIHLNGDEMHDRGAFDAVELGIREITGNIADPSELTSRQRVSVLHDAYALGIVTLQEADAWHHAHIPETGMMLSDGNRLPLEPFGPPEPPVCECCACPVEDRDAMVECNGHVFCSDDCAHEAGYERCAHCGDWGCSDDGIMPGDEWYCSSACAYYGGWTECGRCGSWVRNEDTWTVRSGGEEQKWCEWCYDNYASQCWGCDNAYDDNVLSWCEEDDHSYCEDCYPRESRYLHEYGFTPPLSFYGDAKKSPYLGYELETDGGNDRGSYVCALAAIEGFGEHFYMTKDSSLNNGVEITSHPMTLAYAVSIGPTMEKIRAEALRYGFRSHDGGRCGLHVHVNKDFFGKDVDAQDLGGYKMMRLLQRFETQFLRFARRRDAYWCSFQTDRNYEPDNPDEVEPTADVLDKAKRMKRETAHAQALNFQHDETFEIRIFRGTLNLSTFYACLAMANGLAHVAKMHSAYYVENVTWTELMEAVLKACDEPTATEHLRTYLDRNELM